MTEPARILLVGGSGRVGRMVLHYWRTAPTTGVEIVEQHRDPTRPTGLRWDLTCHLDPRRLAALSIDTVVCLAGVTPGPGADLMLNTTFAQAVLDTAHQAGISRVLLASSSAVYGAHNDSPFSEQDEPLPVNAYGASKLAMEATSTIWRAKGLEVCCLRIGNVAGADALFLNVANGVSPLHVDCFPDGRGPLRSYIGAGTLADVLISLATAPTSLPQLLNVAAPGAVYMEDLARAAAHPFTYHPAPGSAFQRITLDCSRLCSLHSFDRAASNPATMVDQWKWSLAQ